MVCKHNKKPKITNELRTKRDSRQSYSLKECFELSIHEDRAG